MGSALFRSCGFFSWPGRAHPALNWSQAGIIARWLAFGGYNRSSAPSRLSYNL